MAQETCMLASSFALSGPAAFPGRTFYVSVDIDQGSGSTEEILGYDWYLDGIQVLDHRGQRLEGMAYCGDHIVTARVLTANGWSGLKRHYFSNCRALTATVLEAPDEMNEGDTVALHIYQLFPDGTRYEVTSSYSFTTVGGGSFFRNQYTAPQNESLVDHTVQLIARSLDGLEHRKDILIRNIDRPALELGDFDYLVIKFAWTNGAINGLDIRVGFEGGNTAFDGQYVGYGNPNHTIPFVEHAASQAYLYWPYDGVLPDGQELILLNRRQLLAEQASSGRLGDFSPADFSGTDFSIADITDRLQLGLYAIWRGGQIGSGLFTVAVNTYVGGNMELQDMELINIAGQQTFAARYELYTDRANSSATADYYPLGNILLDKMSGRTVLTFFGGSSTVTPSS